VTKKSAELNHTWFKQTEVVTKISDSFLRLDETIVCTSKELQKTQAENITTSKICTGIHTSASTQHTSNCCAMQYKEVKLQLLEQY
ncbi:hypothetical protein DPMN_089277, partial [Dreissena polymorpha]